MSYEAQTSGIVDHAFLQNLFEHGRRNGFLTGGVVTSDGTDLDSDFTAFEAVIDGTYVSVAASKVTHDAGDGSNPRMDAVVCNSSGTVSIVKGTATAETSSQTRPPLGTLPSGSLIMSTQYVPTSASVLLDANQFDRRVMIDVTTEGPLVPPSVDSVGALATKNITTNTTGRVGLIEVTRTMLVTNLVFEATAAGTTGTLDFALFSNDGQTQIIPSTTTASISGASVEATALATATVIPPGLYYIMFVPNGTAAITVRVYTGAITAGSSAGVNEIAGTLTVTASTIPSTFDPDGDVTFANDECVVVKFE